MQLGRKLWKCPDVVAGQEEQAERDKDNDKTCSKRTKRRRRRMARSKRTERSHRL